VTVTAADPTRTGAGPAGVGLWFALLSAASFGTSGGFAKSLLEAGWSPGAAVTARIGGAAVVLAVPTAVALRGRWSAVGQHRRMLLTYGVVAMAFCQFCYFNAVTTLSVGVALLLEYLAPVLIVGWLWLRSGRRPSRLTILGSVVSLAGLVLVLNITGSVRVDPIGVMWGLAAAVSVVVYFLLSARVPEGLPPLAMAGAGMVVAAVSLSVAGLVGLMPLEASTSDVTFLDEQVSWYVPVLGMVVLSTALAYTSGIAAARRLGGKLAAFVGLTEVLCAVLFAWLLLGELPLPIQLGGGVLIVVGIACVRYDEFNAQRFIPEPRRGEIEPTHRPR
jgi:drug/metabolite transporter (DMT)-like permease